MVMEFIQKSKGEWMSKIELESEGVFCPQCGSKMKPLENKEKI
jgi:DNA-directed RNA polymerase subunit RPC12/RpoP